jgi:ABC-type uncharacterized transport system fused permease/ATPase subunit
VITNAEEIAFLGGEAVERSVLYKAFFSVTDQCKLIFKRRFGFVVLEQFMMKYVWTAAGNVMIALAAFSPDASNASVGDRTMAYSISSNLLEQGAGKSFPCAAFLLVSLCCFFSHFLPFPFSRSRPV